jgi:hypothetical protein
MPEEDLVALVGLRLGGTGPVPAPVAPGPRAAPQGSPPVAGQQPPAAPLAWRPGPTLAPPAAAAKAASREPGKIELFDDAFGGFEG